MLETKVYKDVMKYKPKLVGPLNTRQFIWCTFAAFLTVPTAIFLSKMPGTMDAKGVIIVFQTFILCGLGCIEKDGKSVFFYFKLFLKWIPNPHYRFTVEDKIPNLIQYEAIDKKERKEIHEIEYNVKEERAKIKKGKKKLQKEYKRYCR